LKWYQNQLEPICFKAWNESSSLFLKNKDNSCSTHDSSKDIQQGSESEESSVESDISTSSSYSSLCDFAKDSASIYTSETVQPINSAPDKLFCDSTSVCHPPSTLQYPTADLISSHDSKLHSSFTQGSASSSPAHTSSSSSSASDEDNDNDDDGGDGNFKDDDAINDDVLNETKVLENRDDIECQKSPPPPLTPSHSPRQTGPPSPFARFFLDQSEGLEKEPLCTKEQRCSTPQKTALSENRSFSNEVSLERSSSVGSSPTLSRTISISSVFSRTGSLVNAKQASSQNNSNSGSTSFLDRITNEAKEVAREAKAAAVEASKSAIEATKKEVGRKKLLKNLQAFGEAKKDTTKDGLRNEGKDEQSSKDSESIGISIMSSVSSDFNGFADKTTSMLSGLFGSKASGLAEKMSEKAQRFGPLTKSTFKLLSGHV